MEPETDKNDNLRKEVQGNTRATEDSACGKVKEDLRPTEYSFESQAMYRPPDLSVGNRNGVDPFEKYSRQELLRIIYEEEERLSL